MNSYTSLDHMVAHKRTDKTNPTTFAMRPMTARTFRPHFFRTNAMIEKTAPISPVTTLRALTNIIQEKAKVSRPIMKPAIEKLLAFLTGAGETG